MRLIGGNISDTPVKEIADGSAFNVGGAAGAPALITLDSFSAAATATGWDSLEPNTSGESWGGTGYGTVKQQHMKDDQDVYVWRSSVDNKVKAAVVDYHATTGVATYGAENDLSDFTTSAHGPVWIDRISATSAMIMSCVNTDPQKFEWRQYDISSGSLAGAAAKQTWTLTATTYPYNHHAAGIHVVNADNCIVKANDYYFSSNGNMRYVGAKFTASQSQNSTVDLGATYGPVCGGHSFAWGNGTDLYWVTNVGKIVVATVASSPPVITGVSVKDAGTHYSGGYSFTVGDLGSNLLLPATQTETSEHFFLGWGRGLSYYAGVTEDADPFSAGSFGANSDNVPMVSSTGTGAHVDVRAKYIDKIDNTHRFIFIQALASKIRAKAFNFDTVSKRISFGPSLDTTNITKHATGMLFGVSYPKAGATSLNIIVQDDASAVKGLNLSFTP